jgi:hypothetical protein
VILLGVNKSRGWFIISSFAKGKFRAAHRRKIRVKYYINKQTYTHLP